MVGIWLMGGRKHWWLLNAESDSVAAEWKRANKHRLPTSDHYFDTCRAVTENGDGGRCDLRAKWGRPLVDITDAQLAEIFIDFRLTMQDDERFAEWWTRKSVQLTVDATSL